jgi:hypothetical protein
LRKKREEMRGFGPDLMAWDAAMHQYEKNRALVLSAKQRGEKPPVGLSTTFPADRGDMPEARRLARQIAKLGASLNGDLSRYSFHPEVAYVLGAWPNPRNVWAGCMVPNTNKRWFELQVNGSTICEADAVLALVRLDLQGELEKVSLCEMCHTRWRVRAHSNYRFCSKECREEFYEAQPDYHERKRKNQQRYRQREKIEGDQARVLVQRIRRGE